jgi:hypothetical protein
MPFETTRSKGSFKVVDEIVTWFGQIPGDGRHIAIGNFKTEAEARGRFRVMFNLAKLPNGTKIYYVNNKGVMR